MIVVYILIFIVCLSVLIMIHELGHLSMAKAFNVYCFEYSIGFGPAIFRKKRKNGETYFALRAIPFGGFVSMYGEVDEDMELPEGVGPIPEERSLSRIKKWKRAIILVAGVTLNAVLALVLFFVANCLPQQKLYINSVEIAENSIAYNAGLRSDAVIYTHEPANPKDKTDEVIVAKKNGYYIIDRTSVVTYADDTTKNVVTMIDIGEKSKLSFKVRSYDDVLIYYPLDEEGKISYSKNVDVTSPTIKSLSITLETCKYDEAQKTWVKSGESFNVVRNKTSEDKLESMGISMLLTTVKKNFGGIMKGTFTDFGESSILIFRALGNLLVGKGWNQVGGIVSIYTQSTKMLVDYGVSQFITLWAIISVNLAIMNLLPFPGLDGWQLLVLAVEAIAHREIPKKVKTIVSLVGIAILFAFMVLIIIKDIIGLF